MRNIFWKYTIVMHCLLFKYCRGVILFWYWKHWSKQFQSIWVILPTSYAGLFYTLFRWSVMKTLWYYLVFRTIFFCSGVRSTHLFPTQLSQTVSNQIVLAPLVVPTVTRCLDFAASSSVPCWTKELEIESENQFPKWIIHEPVFGAWLSRVSEFLSDFDGAQWHVFVRRTD